MKKNVLQTLFAVSAVLLGIFSARAQESYHACQVGLYK